MGLTLHRSRILDGISWKIAPGGQAAILGPNGSGKSTLLRIITGYQFATDGTVEVLGRTIGRTDMHRLRRRIGLVDPGNPYPFSRGMSALDVVLTGFFGNRCLDFDRPTAEQVDSGRRVLADVGLAGRESQAFHTLSTGETRRTLLARALVADPQMLILDEPTAGLDLLARETFLAGIDRLTQDRPELTVLLVTHHIEELSPATTDVLLLSDGRAAGQGTAEATLTDEHVSQAFGCKVAVSRNHGRWNWSVQPGEWRRLNGDFLAGDRR